MKIIYPGLKAGGMIFFVCLRFIDFVGTQTCSRPGKWGTLMCEGTAYVVRDGQERKVMDNVILIQPEGDEILLADLLGKRQIVRGTIKKIDLLKHLVVIVESAAHP
jgi:predicted RNA-binding protein